MRPIPTALSASRKFIVVFVVLAAAATFAYLNFVEKSKRAEIYEELTFKLGSMRVSITKLEYLLDMYVVAGRFEETTESLIKNDVDRLGRSINELTGNPEYADVMNELGEVADGIRAINEQWALITVEVKRLNEATSRDEAIIIHNAVDTNTILMSEVLERLISAVAARGKAQAVEVRSAMFRALIVFIFMLAAAVVYAYKSVISPVAKAALVARAVAAGEGAGRFAVGRFTATRALGAELNAMLAAVAGSIEERDRRVNALDAALRESAGQLDAIRRFLSASSRTTSISEVYASAAREAVAAGKASAAAVYMIEGASLLLKGSHGFDDDYRRRAASLPLRELGGIEGRSATVVYGDGAPFPYQRLSELLREGGFASLIASPIRFGGDNAGFVFAACKLDAEAAASTVQFIDSVASGLGVLVGYSDLFQREHALKRYYERVLAQFPSGLAVFDRTGACLMDNPALRRFYGADPDKGLKGSYNAFSDSLLASSGAADALRRTFDGVASETVLSYSPAGVAGAGFTGRGGRVKLRSFPIYDASGDVSTIAVIYDEFAPHANRGRADLGRDDG